jgi:hypothetical protein
MCYVEPLNVKNPIAKNGPYYQHVLTRVMSFFLNDLNNFDKSNPMYSFVADLTWKVFFRTRAFIQSYNVIELSICEDIQTPEGVLITVSCRPKPHDLIIVYVPNIPLFGAEPYFYVEYLTTLHSLLLLQGFDSPAVFICKFPDICKESPAEMSLRVFVDNYIEIAKQNPNSKIVLMGDAMGATLILNFLALINNVFVNDASNRLLEIIAKENAMLKPFATVLISPIVKLDNDSSSSGSNDYLSSKVISNFATTYCNHSTQEQYNPYKWNRSHIWERVVPDGGMIVTYGDGELQMEEIKFMSDIAFQTNRVKIVKGVNKCHCWQFVSFMTEETQDEKEDSCFMLAGMLSRMALYKITNYRDPERSHEPMNLLTIDDDHV